MPTTPPVAPPPTEKDVSPPSKSSPTPLNYLSALLSYMTSIINAQGAQIQTQAEEAIAMTGAASAQATQASQNVATVQSQLATQTQQEAKEKAEQKKWGWLDKLAAVVGALFGGPLGIIMALPQLCPGSKTAKAITGAEDKVVKGITSAMAKLAKDLGVPNAAAFTKILSGIVLGVVLYATSPTPMSVFSAGQDNPKLNVVQKIAEGSAMAAKHVDSDKDDNIKNISSYVSMGVGLAATIIATIALSFCGGPEIAIPMLMQRIMTCANLAQAATGAGAAGLNISEAKIELDLGKLEKNELATSQSNMTVIEGMQKVLANMTNTIDTSRQNAIAFATVTDRSLAAMANPYSQAAQQVG